MNKWYTSQECETPVIISSRIRLARNLNRYPFPIKLTDAQAEKMLAETVSSIKNERTQLGAHFEFINMNGVSNIDKQYLTEKHLISPQFAKSRKNRGLLLQDDETVSIMVNEEDHLRIQSIYPGDNIDKSWDLADKIDNLIEESLAYAFDKDFGYLTACPTNTGTALRASYMVHLPLIDRTMQLKKILEALGKFGMTIRGIYGEGSEPLGNIYQISNQLTMGKTEQEIIEALKNITSQIIESEMSLRENVLATKRIEIEDGIYRSYGILTNCRKISAPEAMTLLSDIRLGYVTRVLQEPLPKINIYNIIMNIQPGNLQKFYGKPLNESERDIVRAEYIRGIFKQS